ncbi:MAG: endonuclease V [Sedimentisphaerales bacterium]|nr:endonuclease V [Sedimentisphaerales bacterium]
MSYKEAIELQKKLAGSIRFTPFKKTPKLIAGIDCAFTKDKQKIIGCVVVLKYPELSAASSRDKSHGGWEVVETKHAVKKLTFPYIPGLLSFREAPVCLAAVEKLKTTPDMFMVDGQGIAHPRRLGLAAHLGLFLDKPTIGCAKSRLIGQFEEPLREKGSYSLLADRKVCESNTRDERRATSDEVIGAVLRTRDSVKPVFVSVGNLCRLDDAVKWVLLCSPKFRLPEPTRLADIEAAKMKSKLCC